jgi:glucose-6-phosphate isomerase
VIDDGLEIPESNREIALHLRAMRREVEQINNRMDDFEGSVTQKNIRFQDLIFSVVGGIVVYLCTQLLPLSH